MDSNRVRSIRGACAEDSAQGHTPVASGMNCQGITAGSIEPGQYQNLIIHAEIGEPGLELGPKHKPCFGSSLTPLLRRLLESQQG